MRQASCGGGASRSPFKAKASVKSALHSSIQSAPKCITVPSSWMSEREVYTVPPFGLAGCIVVSLGMLGTDAVTVCMSSKGFATKVGAAGHGQFRAVAMTQQKRCTVLLSELICSTSCAAMEVGCCDGGEEPSS